jgi:hypothetical protein
MLLLHSFPQLLQLTFLFFHVNFYFPVRPTRHHTLPNLQLSQQRNILLYQHLHLPLLFALQSLPHNLLNFGASNLLEFGRPVQLPQYFVSLDVEEHFDDVFLEFVDPLFVEAIAPELECFGLLSRHSNYIRR